jgi:hypothetical protein
MTEKTDANNLGAALLDRNDLPIDAMVGGPFNKLALRASPVAPLRRGLRGRGSDR